MNRVPRLTRWLLMIVVSAAALGGGVIAAASLAASLPDACSLLTQAEAATLAGTPLNAPDASGGDYCQFTGPTAGPEAQVELTIGTDTPRTLELDRQLGHQFTTIPNLGDEAYEEDWNIFVRKGTVWVGISLVRPDGMPADYAQPLQAAAAEALTQVPASVTSTQNPPPQVAGKIPAGKHTNRFWSTRQQRLYGGNLDELKNVVYQRDVVLIPDGPNAIRGVSSNGLTWTLAPGAPGVSKLHVGAIMAASTRALGRVVAIKKVGSHVQVTIGPVDLPQVFSQATFDGHNVPLRQPLFEEDASTDTPTQAGSSTRSPLVGARPEPSATPSSQKPVAGGTLQTGPICCAPYTGEYWFFDNNEGRLSAHVGLLLPKPTIDFEIDIHDGALQKASLAIHGATGFDYHLGGATKNVGGNFTTGLETDPVSVTVPLAGGITLTISQSFHLAMQLAGAAAFAAKGEYGLTGDLGFTYQKGQGTHADGLVAATKQDVFEHSSWLGNGTNSVILDWKIKTTLGIGTGLLTAGAYVSLTPSLGISEDGAFGTSKYGCLYGTLQLQAGWGVGYTLSNFVKKFINGILGAVGAKPIAGEGNKPLGSKTLLNQQNALYCPPPS